MRVPLTASNKRRYNKPLYLHGAEHASALFLWLMTIFYVHIVVYNGSCAPYVISPDHSTVTTIIAILQMEMPVNLPKAT